jgi:hypothetical protein
VRVLALVFVAGCCGSPRSTFPMPAEPDRTCDTGGPAGFDVYVWDCTGDQHVVIYRFRGEWGCDSPKKEVAACGAPTPFETEHFRQLDHCRARAKDW